MQIAEVHLRVSATALQGLMILPTYQVMGIVGVWLTFESDGWHFDSCLGNGDNSEERGTGDFVGVS